VSNINSDRLELYVRQKSIDKSIEDAIRKVLAQKGVVADLESRKGERENERESIYNDQQRIRENMKSLKGSSEEKALLQRYTQQLNQQETRLDALKKEMEQLDAQIEKAEAEVDRMIEALSFDVAL
jgi:chromosome segregation ATPase